MYPQHWFYSNKLKCFFGSTCTLLSIGRPWGRTWTSFVTNTEFYYFMMNIIKDNCIASWNRQIEDLLYFKNMAFWMWKSSEKPVFFISEFRLFHSLSASHSLVVQIIKNKNKETLFFVSIVTKTTKPPNQILFLSLG